MSRASLIRTVHVGARALGLDDDARRDLQLAATGVASLKDMTEAQMRAVLDRMKGAGFDARSGRPHKVAPRADLRLCHVLWRILAEGGAVRSPGRAGLNAFVRSRFGEAWGAVPADVDMIRDHAQIEAVIRALTEMGTRAGLDMGRTARPRRARP